MAPKEVTTPNFVYFGTGTIAVAVLDALHEAHTTPRLIVTAPDRKQGRGMQLTSPPAKVWAEAHGIATIQPEEFDDAFFELLKGQDTPVFALADYGKILPQELIDIPKRGILNVHPSLLPLHRGPTPIHAQILADEPTVGVSIMLIDEKMDHGPLLAQTQVTIEDHDWPPTEEELSMLLAAEGGALLAHVLPQWIAGDVEAHPQDHTQATYCKRIQKKDGLLDLDADPRTNYLKFCAYARWPRTYFFADSGEKKRRIIITDAAFENGEFVIKRVIPEGKKEMDYEAFVKL